MNSLGICNVIMVLAHPFLYHFRGKARWYLALSVMKKPRWGKNTSFLFSKKEEISGLLLSTCSSLPHHPKEHIPFVKGGEQRISKRLWKCTIRFGFFFGGELTSQEGDGVIWGWCTFSGLSERQLQCPLLVVLQHGQKPRPTWCCALCKPPAQGREWGMHKVLLSSPTSALRWEKFSHSCCLLLQAPRGWNAAV